MLALHRARRDLDPVLTPISFYARGPGGWLLAVSLITSGLGLVTIAWSLGQRIHRRLGPRLLVVGGLGLIVAAIFPANPWFPWEKPLTPMGVVHASAVSIAVLLFPIAAFLITRDERRATEGRWLNRLLDVLTFGYLLTVALFGGLTLVHIAFGRAPDSIGLAERIMMTLAVTWLAAATKEPVTSASSPTA